MDAEQLIMEENGKRYRMLQIGETTEEGDEVNLIGVGIGWRVIRGNTEGRQINPRREGYMPQGYYRRPIQ